MRISFSRDYKIDFERSPGPGTLHLRDVESSGSDLEELLSNVTISLETDHGNEGPDWDLADLPDRLITMIEQDLASALQDAHERAAEAAAENQAAVRDLNKGRGI